MNSRFRRISKRTLQSYYFYVNRYAACINKFSDHQTHQEPTIYRSMHWLAHPDDWMD